jgi:hypothetical protein
MLYNKSGETVFREPYRSHELSVQLVVKILRMDSKEEMSCMGNMTLNTCDTQLNVCFRL